MDKRITSILASVMTAFMLVVNGLVIDQIVSYNETELIFAALLTGLGSLVMVYFLITDVFIGRKTYYVGNKMIKVGRKGKLLYTISSDEIVNARLISDALSGKACYFVFEYNGKRHCFTVDEGNDAVFKRFSREIQLSREQNTLEYLLIFIMESFSVI